MSNSSAGVCRGQVVDNIDPQMEGRVRVVVPDIDGQERWAMPCAPYAGPNVGFFALPPIGANVWILFEAGDTAKPVWIGGFWGTGELPAADAKPEIRFLRTPHVDVTIEDHDGGTPPAKLTIKIDDGNRIELTEGKIILTTPSGSSIELSNSRIELSGGEIELNGWPIKFSPLGTLLQQAQS